MTDFGSDFQCVDDITSDLSVVSGQLGVAQSVARRILCPAGALWYDPDYGYGVQRWLCSTAPPVETIASAISTEARKDERVKTCSAVVEFDQTENTLTIDFVLTTADGPFEFTMLVGALTASLLLKGVTFSA